MQGDGFSRFHPAVNFVFFMGAIGFGVVLQHPVYMLAGILCGICYYLVLSGVRGVKTVLGMLPVFALITLINPLLNTRGRMVLFTYFDRPYTLEAVCYGAVLGGMFVLMMVWFGCYNAVLTSDKFVCLFGGLIPSLSLLLVMVLRLIPSFIRKARQITGARISIGKGIASGAGVREKAEAGLTILSSLTDWALEGSIVTADSMRSRGYGCGKRTSFQIYRMSVRDWIVLGLEVILGVTVIVTIATGGAEASFSYGISIAPIDWRFFGYVVFLLIPVIIDGKEALLWHIIRSKI